MLRLATNDDVGICVELATQFYQQTQYKNIELNHEAIVDLVRSFILSDRKEKITILWEEGGKATGLIAGQAMFVPFIQKRVAVECLWWVNPEERGKPGGKNLLEAFEEWATITDCDFLQMMSLPNQTGKILDRFYQRRGYTLTELTYTKELK